MKRILLFVIFLTISVKACHAQVPVSLSPQPVLQFVDGAGKPYANGTITTWAGGTNSLQATYRDSTGTAQNTNPTVLDSSGRAQIWLARQDYKVQLKDAAGHSIWIVDHVKDSTLALLTGANTWSGPQTFNGIVNFNDLANINSGGTFAGTITGQPNWSQLQIFPAGIQIGANGIQETPGATSIDFRPTVPGPALLQLLPNGTASPTSGTINLFRTDPRVSGGNDELLTFAGVNDTSCILVVTPCYRLQSLHTGTGTSWPLVIDIPGGAPTVLFKMDGTTNFYNQPVVFTGTEFGATTFQVQENAGLLTFHNIVSPPVGSALAINQDVVETQHLVVGTTANLGGPTPQIINHMWTFTGALDSAFTAIAAQTCQEQPVTITGVAGGAASAVSASPASNLGNVSLTWAARVSGANTVQVKVCNVTSGSLTPTSVNWSIFVAN